MRLTCIDNKHCTEALTIGEIYEGKDNGCLYEIINNFWVKSSYNKNRFEVVEDKKEVCNMVKTRETKTFKEIIAQGIKANEFWEGDYEDIVGTDNGVFKIGWKGDIKKISEQALYTLYVESVSFGEAFKEYENEKWIESCVTGNLYRKSKEDVTLQYISTKEIRGGWIIG